MYHALEYLEKTRVEYRHAFLSGLLVSIFVFASAGWAASFKLVLVLRILARASKLTQSPDLFGIRDETRM
jgi:hypothetical protein